MKRLFFVQLSFLVIISFIFHLNAGALTVSKGKLNVHEFKNPNTEQAPFSLAFCCAREIIKQAHYAEQKQPWMVENILTKVKEYLSEVEKHVYQHTKTYYGAGVENNAMDYLKSISGTIYNTHIKKLDSQRVLISLRNCKHYERDIIGCGLIIGLFLVTHKKQIPLLDGFNVLEIIFNNLFLFQLIVIWRPVLNFYKPYEIIKKKSEYWWLFSSILIYYYKNIINGVVINKK